MTGLSALPGRREWRDLLLLSLAGLLLLGWAISLMLPVIYPFANDSAGYLQEARNWLRGQGLLRGANWSDPEHDYAAFPLYPPGFSLLIAGLSQTGLSLPDSALAASWLAWWLLLPATAYALRPLAGRWASMLIAVLVASSPGFVEWGYLALSDAAMILFSVLSLGILLRLNCGRPGFGKALLLSGILAGCAYALRNAAAVLPLTVMVFLAWQLLSRPQQWRAPFVNGIAWGAGFAAIAFPVFLYNLHTFGSIQPYFAAHGGVEYGLLRAFRISLWSLLLDFTSWRQAADIAWDATALVLIALPLGLFLLWRGRQQWKRASQGERAALLLLLIYLGIGFAMIVWGRSRFDWVETTLTRQLMPYTWAALAAVLWVLKPASPSSTPQQTRMTGMLLMAGAILLWGRVDNAWSTIQREHAIRDTVATQGHEGAAAAMPGVIFTNHIKRYASRDRELLDLLAGLPQDAYLLSNHAALLSLTSGRNVRDFAPTADNLEALARMRARLQGRPVVMILLPTNTLIRQGQAATWKALVAKDLPTGSTTLLDTATTLAVQLP